MKKGEGCKREKGARQSSFQTPLRRDKERGKGSRKGRWGRKRNRENTESELRAKARNEEYVSLRREKDRNWIKERM